jgi:hypothetical protein
MFNPTLIVIEAFIRELRTMYDRTYGTMEPGYPGIISFVPQLALENIATSDAAYHDVKYRHGHACRPGNSPRPAH